MTRLGRHSLSWILVLGLAACTQGGVGEEIGETGEALHSTTTTGPGFTRVDVEHRGGVYSVIQPDAWNGTLVSIGHGWVNPALPVGAPDDPAIQGMEDFAAFVVSQGFGAAFTTYRSNGFAVQEGTGDLRFAEALFRRHFGSPGRRYIVGQSMGGHVAQKLTERFQNRYDGFLSMCGAVGGATTQWEHNLDVRVLFDYYFPGVVPGTPLDNPPADFFGTVAPAIAGAMVGNPAAAVELGSVHQLGIAWTSFPELIEGVITVLYIQSQGTTDLLSRARGNPVGNAHVTYSGSSDDVALNAGVARFDADRRAASWLERNYDPDGGVPSTKVFALHTTRDPAVPAFQNVDSYEALMTSEGNGERFASRQVDAFGHCTFSPTDTAFAFFDLVFWVEAGIPPAP